MPDATPHITAPRRPAPSRRQELIRLLAPLVLALGAGCGEAPPDVGGGPSTGGALPAEAARSSSAPRRVVVPEPTLAVRGALDNEALAESVSAWLATLGNKIRIRDFDGLHAALAHDFLGENVFAAAPESTRELALGARRFELAGPPGAPLDRDGFLSALEGYIGSWRRVTQARWHLQDARFQRGEPVEWGRLCFDLHLVGVRADGTTEVLEALFAARAVNDAGNWRLDRLAVESRERVTGEAPLFVEIARAAGVAHDGLRYGEPGNDDDGWNGAAAGDVDGDGLFDLVVPSSRRTFLYRNRGDGTFAEEAAARGLAGDVNGTGALLFDFDRDGDQDLALAHVGWRELDGGNGGRPLALYENDGRGNFSSVGAERGFERYLPAFSMTAFDYDGDGWTDVFVCGYGRMEHAPNDSWIRATNGASDQLLRNDRGRFVDVTSEAGLGDRDWSYASAAADYDEDGDLDLYVGNNFGDSRLWRNEGDGTFVDVARELGVAARGNVMGVTWADLNCDGRLDLYLSSPTSTTGRRVGDGLAREGREGLAESLIQMARGNKLFLADGEGGFEAPEEELGAEHAGWSWGAAATDFDLDGTLDLACANGFVTGELSGDT